MSALRIKPSRSRSPLSTRLQQLIHYTPAGQHGLHCRLYVITSGGIQWPGTTIQKQHTQTTVLERHGQSATSDARSDDGNVKMSCSHSHAQLSGFMDL
jgi:hypothetical protein